MHIMCVCLRALIVTPPTNSPRGYCFIMQRRLIEEGNNCMQGNIHPFYFHPLPSLSQGENNTLYSTRSVKMSSEVLQWYTCIFFVFFFFFLDPPSQPSVTEVTITPTTADFIVRFSSVSNAPPPKRLKVTVTPFPTERVQYFTVGMCHLQYLINETNPFCNQGNWRSKKKEKNVRVKVYHTCYYATL